MHVPFEKNPDLLRIVEMLRISLSKHIFIVFGTPIINTSLTLQSALTLVCSVCKKIVWSLWAYQSSVWDLGGDILWLHDTHLTPIPSRVSQVIHRLGGPYQLGTVARHTPGPVFSPKIGHNSWGSSE